MHDLKINDSRSYKLLKSQKKVHKQKLFIKKEYYENTKQFIYKLYWLKGTVFLMLKRIFTFLKRQKQRNLPLGLREPL